MHDAVGVFHDHALILLAEDAGQANGGHHPAANHLAEDVARAHAGQLIRVAHHDNAAAVLQGGQQALEELGVHHAHLIQHHHIALEQVFLVVDEAQQMNLGVIVHLQQPVDGLGLLAGELAQPFGGPTGGRAQSHPIRLILEQGQNGVHGGGLAGTGAAV